uniref:Uncharacterized protein n=1 Tax=Timema cristinae TaxID=61476 RepID=A0A7R9DE88_TIMCR|nr:unnamed protein product [Timema cristinae]
MSNEDDLGLIPTKCSRLRSGGASSFQSVVFETHKSTKKRAPSQASPTEPGAQKDVIDMKRVRYEVFKFAMSGYNREKKEEAEVNLAIKLGARPPKNKYYNYKELKKMKEDKEKESVDRLKLIKAGKDSKGKSNDKGLKRLTQRRRRAEKSGILDPYGKPFIKEFDSKKIEESELKAWRNDPETLDKTSPKKPSTRHKN